MRVLKRNKPRVPNRQKSAGQRRLSAGPKASSADRSNPKKEAHHALKRRGVRERRNAERRKKNTRPS
jgi:hypothetical protein